MTPIDDTNQNYVAETPQYEPQRFAENKPTSSNKAPLVIGIIVLVLGLLYVVIIRPMLKSDKTTTEKSTSSNQKKPTKPTKKRMTLTKRKSLSPNPNLPKIQGRFTKEVTGKTIDFLSLINLFEP